MAVVGLLLGGEVAVDVVQGQPVGDVLGVLDRLAFRDVEQGADLVGVLEPVAEQGLQDGVVAGALPGTARGEGAEVDVGREGGADGVVVFAAMAWARVSPRVGMAKSPPAGRAVEGPCRFAFGSR